jgi:hypothetical protein
MDFKTIYHFTVMDEIRKGNTVYCLDKANRCVLTMNSLSFDDAIKILDEAEERHYSYEFWKEVEETDG